MENKFYQQSQIFPQLTSIWRIYPHKYPHAAFTMQFLTDCSLLTDSSVFSRKCDMEVGHSLTYIWETSQIFILHIFVYTPIHAANILP